MASWVGSQVATIRCKWRSGHHRPPPSPLPSQLPSPSTSTAVTTTTPSTFSQPLRRYRHMASSTPTPTPTTAPTSTSVSSTSSSTLSNTAMQLTDLPYTIFVEIVSYLSATDAIVCRRISREVRQALTRTDLCITLIQLHFPRSREGRLLRRYLELDSPPSRRAVDAGDWAAVFSRLTRRYLHLGSASPWRTRKVPVSKDTTHLRGVTPWNRFLQLDDKTAPFHYWDPVWTFAPAEGLLVYPTPATKARQVPEYRVRHLETEFEVTVPFDVAHRVVRRVRLSHGVLIVEWCEEEAYHPLNDREAAHRHFATSYDVKTTGQSTNIIPQLGCAPTRRPSLAVTFRSEWKIHYLGLPLSHQDRFFSTHNSTHYVVYIWQPTRSPWGEDDPLERLIIWELGDSAPYRPSLDPGGTNKPPWTSGPRIVRRMTNGELGHWDIRQSDTPTLRDLVLDDCTWDKRSQSTCGHVFFLEEEHRWSAGPHSTPTPPRLHRVKSTGIPLQGQGPRWLDECGGGGTEGSDVNLGFCWRGPRRRRTFNGGSAPSRDVRKDYDPCEAWPGRAPCWRHDDFPYLTVSEVFDAPAGVRISARQCFMLETLSVHIRPKLRVQGVQVVHINGIGGSGATSRSNGSSDSSGVKILLREEGAGNTAGDGLRVVGTRAEGPDGEEVQFSDSVWGELLGKGFICGDERWLVGEDANGDVTVLQF